MFPDSLYPTLSMILSRTQQLRIIIIERSTRNAQAPSFRHRVGRGGRRYVDHRMSPFTLTPLVNRTPPGMSWLFNPPAAYPAFAIRVPPWIGFPHPPATPTTESKANKDVDEDMEAFSQKLRDRWKFDPDTVLNGAVHGGRTIIDDFDYR
jgi:hypothetical protein